MRRIYLLLFFFGFVCFGFSQDSIWIARAKGKLPFLEYGIGDDRLGGAKMGYIDSNILLVVVDSFNTDYKVRLSAYHSAYIAKENISLLHKEANRRIAHNTNLSGSWKVYGEGDFDYITVNLTESLPYRSFQLIDPSRIVVDVFGVTSNTNWITQLNTSKKSKIPGMSRWKTMYSGFIYN